MSSNEQEHQRLFRYYPGDFGALTIKVIHMDLIFDINEQYSQASSRLTAGVLNSPVKDLVLNAHDVEIIFVSCDCAAISPRYDHNRNILTLTFSPGLTPHTRFTVMTESVCRPSDHILEGLYYDRTPEGAPPT